MYRHVRVFPRERSEDPAPPTKRADEKIFLSYVSDEKKMEEKRVEKMLENLFFNYFFS